MKILIACEQSGIVRDAFINKGHNAISCDIEYETARPGPHYKGNVFDIINDGFDMMIAHPPCTFLANSGVCHLKTNKRRWDSLDSGAEFFRRILNANISKICVENPIPHKYAVERIGGVKYTQIIHPYQFGHIEQKATCLWLKGLKKLKPTDNVKWLLKGLDKKITQRIHYMPPGKDRQRLRSETYEGIAYAMADQWG